MSKHRKRRNRRRNKVSVIGRTVTEVGAAVKKEKGWNSNVQRVMFRKRAWDKFAAWAKAVDTEVAAMGVSRGPDAGFLKIQDVRLLPQTASSGSAEFDAHALGELVEDAYEKEALEPVNVGRIWIHTHPGFSATPSVIDWATLAEDFGRCSWTVMVIIGQQSSTAHLAINMELGRIIVPLTVGVETGDGATSEEKAGWVAEARALVTKEHWGFAYFNTDNTGGVKGVTKAFTPTGRESRDNIEASIISVEENEEGAATVGYSCLGCRSFVAFGEVAWMGDGIPRCPDCMEPLEGVSTNELTAEEEARLTDYWQEDTEDEDEYGDNNKPLHSGEEDEAVLPTYDDGGSIDPWDTSMDDDIRWYER